MSKLSLMENWLNEKLKQRVRDVFEPDYKRKLTDNEVVTIAVNLTDFMEMYIKFRLNKNEKNKNTA